MKIVKTTLLRLGVYCALFGLEIAFCANFVPDKFPFRNLSTLYLLILSVCLVRYYSYRVPGSGNLSFMMRSLSVMVFLLSLFRGIKYSVFAGVDILARHIWYLYYLPMLLLPLFFFYISLIISPKGNSVFPKKWLWTAVITGAFILLVLTNDLHGFVFRFKPGFLGWDGDYTRGTLFYLVFAWQYLLYIAAVGILIFKCRVGSSKRNAWLTLIPFLTGVIMNLLLLAEKMPRINGTYIIEFPESLIFMVVGVLECCMQLGLIPTNKDYGKLFGIFSVSAQITDREGTPVYLSHSAVPLTKEQFSAPDGARIDEHTVLHKMEVPGGYGFWQDDMTEIDRLRSELSEAKEALSQETELIRMLGELKEKQIEIEQRTAVYDSIAAHTLIQSQAISELAKTGRFTNDTAVKEICCKRITLLASFVKRYANLMLLSYENKEIETGELRLSFSEVLRYLNYAGIPGEIICSAKGCVSAAAALAVFSAFGTIITDNLKKISGAFINISGTDKTVLKFTLENLDITLSPKNAEELLFAGVTFDTVCEDDVTYITFSFPERRVKI
ncbi:MAG: hypothetical protein IKF53_05135 [Clostridia bacterium]|nr:hypothetical protein [Clostridia bacterium]